MPHSAMPEKGQQKDTIAAVATPLGQGGVGIVRVSGPKALAIVCAIFQSSQPKFTTPRPYTLHHGWIKDQQDRFIDEVMISFMPGPGSYTGEDVSEINCHGGPVLVQAVLETVLKHGARAADAGEFTKRAYLNGRLDLSQAEAVAELIAAPTQAGTGLAMSRLRGGLGAKISSLRGRLEELHAQLCVAVDFPEDEVECLSTDQLLKELTVAIRAIEDLLSSYERNRCWREGALVVLTGKVNAGKSSLMNALLGKERAIVTPIPGTTRDYLEEAINLQGLPVRIVDTAGLRESQDEVEQAGLNLGRELVEQADLVLLVIDQVEPVDDAVEDAERLQGLKSGKVLLVLNKADLVQEPDTSKQVFTARGFDAVTVSAKTGQGLDNLIRAVRDRITGEKREPAQDELVPNLRQCELLRMAHAELEEIVRDTVSEVPYDLLGVRLDLASSTLAEITGEISSADVLDRIFSQFCIGK